MSFKHDLIIMQNHLAVMHGFYLLNFNNFSFPFKKISFLFSNFFYFILLNILIFPFTNICLIFILTEKYFIFNDIKVLKLYNILTRILLFHLLLEFTNVRIYVIIYCSCSSSFISFSCVMQ